MRAALLLLPLVAACSAGPVATGRAVPQRAILYERTLTVEMSDRSLCVGLRQGAARTWSGTLAGCPHLWPYRAQLPQGAIVRLPLTPGATGTTASAEITDPSGRVHRFGR